MCVIFFRLALSCKRIKITLFLQHHNLIWRLCTSFKSLFMRVNRVAARVWAHLCSVAIPQAILYRIFSFNITTLFSGFVVLLRAYSCVSIELRLGFEHICVVSPYLRPYSVVLFFLFRFSQTRENITKKTAVLLFI